MDTESSGAEEELEQEVDSEKLASGDVYIGEEQLEEAVTEDIILVCNRRKVCCNRCSYEVDFQSR